MAGEVVTRSQILRDDPHVDWGENILESRLTYEGPLLAETHRDGVVRRARADHKQEIRKVFHHQLRRWWDVSPYLCSRQIGGSATFGRPYPQHLVDQVAQRYSMFGYQFVPLVTRELELLCSVDILFLRYGEPGGLISRAGDIDNRLKTLFDALATPRNATQLGRYTNPNSGETPFFCFFEDDSVITKASVETDVLLQPTSSHVDPNDARLVITVRIRPARVNATNVGFSS